MSPTPVASPTRFINQLEPYAYSAIRIIVAFCFALHGMQKLFGLFGKEAVPLFSQMGIGGVIELVTASLMILGLFTRAAAFLASGQMAVAFFQFHVVESGKLLPIQNGGDDTVLYCLWFFFVFVNGPGIWALDNRIFGRHSPG